MNVLAIVLRPFGGRAGRLTCVICLRLTAEARAKVLSFHVQFVLAVWTLCGLAPWAAQIHSAGRGGNHLPTYGTLAAGSQL